MGDAICRLCESQTYSEDTAPQLFNIDEPDLSDNYPTGYLRNTHPTD